MPASGTRTPGPWDQQDEVRDRCPGTSRRQAQKALINFNGDMERTVSHLRYQNSEDEEGLNEEPWLYLRLPELLRPMQLLEGDCFRSKFNLRSVVSAIVSGESLDRVYRYLAMHHNIDEEYLEFAINSEVIGFPAIFYVLEENNIELIRRWVQYGGDVNAVHKATGIPLIAFHILRDRRPLLQSTEMLKELLKLGASPLVIPAAFYNRYSRELPESGPVEADLYDIQEASKAWCKPWLRPLLSAALNITQRYLLNRAARLPRLSGRKRMVARKGNAEALLGIEFLVIGQEIAVDSLKKSLIVHLALQKKAPLALLFAGPSGHGKTELAREFGRLMSLEIKHVDCTMVKREIELFGPKQGLSGHLEGAPLNNFLARMSGKSSVVFLDEFEKTTLEIWNCLHIIMEQGEYEDHRNGRKVDCSETIWILATNAFDPVIHEFCRSNRQKLFESARGPAPALVEELKNSISNECVSHFGATVSGRVTQIVPFITFSPDETPVVAHKKIMELQERLARPIKLSSTGQGDNIVGKIQLDLTRDSMVCSRLAEDYYVSQLGARSIFRGIERGIQEPLVIQYLEDGDDFSEDQPVTKFAVDVGEEKEIQVLLN